MFKILFDRLILLLLPGVLRKQRLPALLKAFLYPLTMLHGDFLNFRGKTLYKVTHNSQVYSMENVFNDRFDPIDRRIYITDGFAKQRIYAYTRLEAKPIYLNKIYLYNRVDYADTGIDFIVWVPTPIFFTPQDRTELTALINDYRLASKRYRIYRV